MTETWSTLGALLLGAAIVPQVVKLARSRTARDFSWLFVLLNLAGLVFLAFRSAELGEIAFLAINVAAAGFWLFAFALKVWEAGNRSPESTESPLRVVKPSRVLWGVR